MGFESVKVGASTNLWWTLCHPKVSGPFCSGSIAYRNVSPGTRLTYPIQKSIHFYQYSIKIEEGAMLPRKIDTVWRIHSCVVCILGGTGSPQMQSLWASCQIPFPSRHRKHHEPCSKTHKQFNVWEREERGREKLQKPICLKRKRRDLVTIFPSFGENIGVDFVRFRCSIGHAMRVNTHDN